MQQEALLFADCVRWLNDRGNAAAKQCKASRGSYCNTPDQISNGTLQDVDDDDDQPSLGN